MDSVDEKLLKPSSLFCIIAKQLSTGSDFKLLLAWDVFMQFSWS